jgi:hypothetical protein
VTRRVPGAPGVVERRALGVDDAEPGVELAVAQVAADRGRRAAGAGADDDPGGHRVPLEGQLLEDRLGDVVVAAPVGRALGVRELVEVVAAALAASAVPRRRSWSGRRRRGGSDRRGTRSARSSRPLVERGMTATNGRPSSRAKYASETAVEPDEASTTVVSGVIQPLHRP